MSKELSAIDFDLSIERSGDRYRARVVNSPGGQATADFVMPTTPAEWVRLSPFGDRQRDLVPKGISQAAPQLAEIGALLFDAVFTDEVLACFRTSREIATREKVSLRLLLRLNAAPELAVWPWECLYDKHLKRFLARSSASPVVRFLDLPEPMRPLQVRPPIRILVMISAPTDYPTLDSAKEWSKLQKAVDRLQAKQVSLTKLETATLPALLEQLVLDKPHILHFIGHGGFVEATGEGELVLEDDFQTSRRVGGQELASLLLDAKSLRLVVLNACEGARASPADAFGGVAQMLLQQSIPATIAMQAAISDPVAITFAGSLYEGVARGLAIDAAVTQARRAILAAHDKSIEWAIPVLYMRAPDGRVFDLDRTTAGTGRRAQRAKPAEPPCGAIWPLLHSGQVVPFLGPYASTADSVKDQDRPHDRPSAAPSTQDLAHHLAASSSFPAQNPRDRDDLAQVASYFADFTSRRALRATLHEFFSQPFDFRRVHRLLAATSAPLLVVTTNYDTLIEQAFQDAGRPYDLVVYPTDCSEYANAVMWWPPDSSEPTILAPNELMIPLDERSAIFKMYGSVDRTSGARDSFVITEEDYVDFLTRMNGYTAIPAQFLDHCRDRSLLFLGCRLDDWNLRVTMKALSRHLDQKRGAAAEEITSWAVQPELSEFERLLWQRCDVHAFELTIDEFAAALARWSH